MVDKENEPTLSASTRKQLELLEATARRPRPSEPASPPAPAGTDSMQTLLAELRRDVQGLKTEWVPPPQSPEVQLRQMLSELHLDIEALKAEQRSRSVKSKDMQLNAMIMELRSDINALQGLVSSASTDIAQRAPHFEPLPPSRKTETSDSVLKFGIPIGIAIGVVTAVGLLLASRELSIGPDGITIPRRVGEISQQVVPVASPTQLLETANTLTKKGDITFARRVLSNAVAQGSGIAALMLARTYDPQYLSQMYNPLGVTPDVAKARVLYETAAQAGIDEAARRLIELGKAHE
jgi:hypothetical protein